MEVDYTLLLQTFEAECAEQLQEIEECLVTIEGRPGDPELVRTILRLAHTIKGSAAVVGCESVVQFTHRLEDGLQVLSREDEAVTDGVITALLKGVDTLKRIVRRALDGIDELTPDELSLAAELSSFAESQDASRPESEADLRAPSERGLGEAGGSDGTEARTGSATLRVPVSKLDKMLDLTGEIAIARAEIRRCAEAIGGQKGEELREACREADRLSMDLQEQVMRVRMVPIEPTFRQYVRTVRDLSIVCNKQARLLIEGGEVELDTAVIEHLRDPLTHMIRNALDHGVEAPDVRSQLGKDPCGTICLRAYHDAGTIVIQCSDDGAGLSREGILARARERGLVSPGATDALSDYEVQQLVFEPGFSTKEAVTDVSGRGVGMEVVRRNVEALRGSLIMDSRTGVGTQVTIRLPLTLAIIEGFEISAGEERYIVPQESVVECLDLPSDARIDPSHGGVIHARGAALPCVRLRDLFSIPARPGRRESLLVIRHQGVEIGLVVDVLHGDRQVVIKPLGRLLKQLPGIGGSAILSSGKVALILDIPGLCALARKRRPGFAIEAA